jgi:hypothetical protein
LLLREIVKSVVLACLLLLPVAGTAEPISFAGRDAGGRHHRLSDHRGKVVLITFFSQYTRDEATRINDVIERRAPRSGVTLFSVFDLAGIPSGFHEYARGRLAKATEGRRIRYLVDDKGECRSAAGANPSGQVDILVVDRGGTVTRHYVGEGRVHDALAVVESLAGS